MAACGPRIVDRPILQQRSILPATRPRSSLPGDIAGGLTGGLMSLPTGVGFGLILAGPLGSEQAAIAVALVAAVVGGLVMAVAGRAGPLTLGGSSAAALVLAGWLQANPHDLGTGLAGIMLIGGLACLLLAAMAAAGLGAVLSRVPYPVLAGILNGTAILMLLSMQPYVLHVAGWRDWSGLRWGEVLVAASVVVPLAFGRMPRRLTPVPMVLVAMAVGVAVQAGLVALAGPDVVGPVLRPLPGPALMVGDAWLGFAGLARLDWAAVLPGAATVAGSIAFLAIVDTMTVISAVQDATGRVTEPRRTLLATALAVLASAGSGGMPVAGSVSSTMASVGAGGTTAVSAALRSVTVAAMVGLLSVVPLQLPMAAMAGVVIAGALRVFELSGLRLIWAALRRNRRHRGELLGHAAVIAAVTGVAVGWSLVAAVGVGLLLSLGVFAVAMARDVVRRTYLSAPGRSRTVRNGAETAVLLAEGSRIVVVEVEGTLFFGSVDDVAQHVGTAAGGTGAGRAACVILDMRRVTRLDLSGARRLVRMVRQLRAGGLALTLAYVRPGLPVWDYLEQLDLLGQFAPGVVFPSLDAALQAAEEAVLAMQGDADTQGVGAEAMLLGMGLGHPAVAALLPHLHAQALAPGERAITAGETADEMFFLLDGRLDVVLRGAGPDPSPRLVTMTAGTLFGEMALLTGGTRSADVVARTAATCLQLRRDTLDLLRRDRPEVAMDLYACIARQMERNLRLANLTIRGLEE